MDEALRFAAIGLGAGAIYGILAQGVVLIYRGSAVLTVAQAGFALCGAFAYFELRTDHGVPAVVALVAATAVSATLGLAGYAVAVRPLRDRSGITKLIGTLGLLLVLQGLAQLRYGANPRWVPSLLPTRPVEVLPDTFVGADRLALLGIGIVITSVLWAGYRYSRFGLVTAAAAEAPARAEGFGYRASFVAAVNWAIAAGLAGFSGALIAPISGLQVSALAQLALPTLAAALAARFVSFPLAFGAGLAIGAAESLLGRYVQEPGWPRAVPLMLVVAVLVTRGRPLPPRGYAGDSRLPKVLGASSNLWRVVGVATVAMVAAGLLGANWAHAAIISGVAALIGMSVVVVTGLGGQLSLATYGVAGLAALVAARVAADLEWPFVACLVVGVLVGGAVGAIIGLPAIRTRGVDLAVVTLAVGGVLEAVLFSNRRYTGGQSGLPLGSPTLLGWDISAVAHPARYASVVISAVGIAIVVVTIVRRSSLGLSLLAVRGNERAASAAGISVASAKIRAFALGGAFAGAGGVLLVFQNSAATFSGFSTEQSLMIVGLVVLGSVGVPGGAVFGGLLVAGGIVTELLDGVLHVQNYVLLVGGVGIIATITLNPDGVVVAQVTQLKRALASRRKAAPAADVSAPSGVGSTSRRVRSTARAVVEPDGSASLDVDRLSVTYGGNLAVTSVSFSVQPGEVVGLIGPNGAGKTTCIDAISGFVRYSGSVRLGGDAIDDLPAHRRARRGLHRSFQSIELCDDLSVDENLRIASARSTDPGAVSDLADVLARLGVKDLRWRLADSLTYGQRKLVGLACALCGRPQVVLLDEPAAGLDGEEVSEVVRRVRQIAREQSIGVVLVEHNVGAIAAACDRVVVLDAGTVLSAGPTAQVLADERVRDAYLGPLAVDGAVVQ